MTYDSRAFVYCNLGDVISGEFQESNPDGGLIVVSGSCVLAGVRQIVPGTKIEFAYYKNGVLARLGRSLYVLGGAADPTQRITTINFGCKLAYRENSAPGPVVLDSANDPETPQLSAVAAAVLLKEITARFIVTECLTALGISYGELPLTNRFYREDFRVTGPYLQTVGEVLISENYAGYMDENDVFQVVNLADTPSQGPLLSGDNIISLAPATQGEPLPTGVYSLARSTAVNLGTELRDEQAYGGGTTLPGRAPTPPGIDPPPEIDGPDTYDDQIKAAQDAYDEELARIQEDFKNGIIDSSEATVQANAAADVLNDVYDDVDILTTGDDGSNPEDTADDALGLGYFNTGSSTPKVESSREYRWTNPENSEEVITQSVSWNAVKSWSNSYSGDNKLQSSVESTVDVYGNIITETYYFNEETENYKSTSTVKTTYKSAAYVVEACGFTDYWLLPLFTSYTAVGGYLIVGEYSETVSTSTETSSITNSIRLVPQAFTSDGANMLKNLVDSYSDENGEPLVSGGALDSLGAAIIALGSKLVVSGGEVTVENSGKRAIPKGPTKQQEREAAQSASGKGSTQTNPAAQAAQERLARQRTWADSVREQLQREFELIRARDEAKKAADEARRQELQRIRDERERSEEEKREQERQRRRTDLVNPIERNYTTTSYSGDAASGATYTYELAVEPELIFIEGSNTDSGVFLELTPPFVPDDKVVASANGYYVVKSDAVNKVTAYARTQYKLLSGRQQGFNVVYPIENYSSTPCQGLFIDVAGVSAQFRATETTIAFDNSGVLMSSIALLEGAVGQSTPASGSGTPNAPAPSTATTSYSITGQKFSRSATIRWRNVDAISIASVNVSALPSPGASTAAPILFDYSITVDGTTIQSGTQESVIPLFNLNNLNGAIIVLSISVSGSNNVAVLNTGLITLSQVT